MTELEDLYLPYKTKRKTRAVKARENGLEPLAKIIMSQKDWSPETTAERFVKDGIESVDQALSGARDIIAEWMSENIKVRQHLRRLFENESVITSAKSPKANEDAQKFQDYFEYTERLKRCPSHRLLAILRGERDNQLQKTADMR